MRNRCPICRRSMEKTIGAWTGETLYICDTWHNTYSVYRDDPGAEGFDWD